jgi:hypothetical protein
VPWLKLYSYIGIYSRAILEYMFYFVKRKLWDLKSMPTPQPIVREGGKIGRVAALD